MEIVIASAIDERYMDPLRVMLHSLVRRLAPDRSARLVLVTRRPSDFADAKLDAILPTHVISRTGPERRERSYPPETAFLLDLPDLPELAAVERVLFLDADLLVLSDIGALWESDLGTRPLGAVRDGTIGWCSAPRGVTRWRERRIPEDTEYFNAGVLLIDLPRVRATGLFEEARAYLDAREGRNGLLNQEALNGVGSDAWAPLDPMWNQIASMTGRRWSTSLSPRDQQGIVHFAGRMKPWRMRIAGEIDGLYLDEMRAVGLERRGTRMSDRALSLYDRRLRRILYPLERRAWQRRWI